jgi:hypothetical protein
MNGSMRERRTSRSGEAVRRKGDTALSVSAQRFSDKVIIGLIDDWIVPALVEQFLGERGADYPDSPDLKHN